MVRAIRRSDAEILLAILTSPNGHGRGTLDYANIQQESGLGREAVHEIVKFLISRKIIEQNFDLMRSSKPFLPGPNTFRVGMGSRVISLQAPGASELILAELRYAYPAEQVSELPSVHLLRPKFEHGAKVVPLGLTELRVLLGLADYSRRKGGTAKLYRIESRYLGNIEAGGIRAYLGKLAGKDLIQMVDEYTYEPGEANLLHTLKPQTLEGVRVPAGRTFWLISDPEMHEGIKQEAENHPVSQEELILLEAGLVYATWPEDEPVLIDEAGAQVLSAVYSAGSIAEGELFRRVRHPLGWPGKKECLGGIVACRLIEPYKILLESGEYRRRYRPGLRRMALPIRKLDPSASLPTGYNYDVIADPALVARELQLSGP